MKEVKEMIFTKSGLKVENQRLIYAGKELRDDVALSEYMIRNQSTLHLIQRLEGGADKKIDIRIQRRLPSHLPHTDEPCTVCCDSPSLLLPCSFVKHPYCSTCVTTYAWTEASEAAKLRSEVKCCLCQSEWSIHVVKEYGAMSDKESHLLEECLSTNYLRNGDNFRQCPGCEVYCEHIHKNNGRVRCHFCFKSGKLGDFCWHCQKPWVNGGSADRCNNCNDKEIIEELKTAPQKDVIGVKCPSRRLCPGCGTAIDHIRYCKHMTCKICKTEFCFICLRKKVEGSWSCGSYNTKCSPAPVQESVPKKA